MAKFCIELNQSGTLRLQQSGERPEEGNEMERASVRVRRRARALACAGVLTCLVAPGVAVAQAPPYKDPAQPVATRVSDLLTRMALDEKLGQMAQAERRRQDGRLLTAQEIATYGLGSVLSGGGSAP